jgi:HSP20 family molecular chaperone IbpA
MEVECFMSGERKKRGERLPFDVFEDFRRIEKVMNEFMRHVYKENKEFTPHVYFFSIRRPRHVDLESKKLSYVDRKRFGPIAKHQRDALVDVLDMKKEVVVVAELPSCKKEDIKLGGTGDVLMISVDKPQGAYLNRIKLPATVNFKEARINYKNRVLEITLPKILKHS